MRSWKIYAVCAAAFLVLAGLAAGQEVPVGPTDQMGVTLRSTTTLIQVSVAAHDAKGLSVRDLKKEDFEVLDNGKARPTAVFFPEQSTSFAHRQIGRASCRERG